MSAFRNKVKEIRCTSFVTKDKSLFKKYKSIWNNIRNIIEKSDKKTIHGAQNLNTKLNPVMVKSKQAFTARSHPKKNLIVFVW